MDDIVLVDDKTTKAAMFLVWERLNQIVESSGAIALAAVLKCFNPKFTDLAPNLSTSSGSQEESSQWGVLKTCKKIGVIFSGGNLDLREWKWE